jgi:hypothetical protein
MVYVSEYRIDWPLIAAGRTCLLSFFSDGDSPKFVVDLWELTGLALRAFRQTAKLLPRGS